MPHNHQTTSPPSHVNIPTPTWRFYNPPPRLPTSTPHLPDSHYLSLHDPLALVERSKWAPPPTSVKTPNRLNRPRPIFPTPAESVTIIQSAFADLCSRSLRHTTSLSNIHPPNLAMFDHALQPLAQVERLLSDLRQQLQAQLPALKRAAAMAPGVTSACQTFSLHMNDQLTSYENAAFTSAKRAHIALEHLQNVLYRKGEDVLAACGEIGNKLQLEFEPPITFCEMRERFAAEVGKEEMKINKKKLNFAESIQRRIDSNRYPMLAKTFTLHPDYCLDGTRKRVEEIVEGMERDVGAATEEDGDDDAVLVVTRENASMRPHIEQERCDKEGNERAGVSVRKVGRMRGIEKKRHMHVRTSRSKKERKSFRVLDRDLEEVRSEGSDSAVRTPMAPVRFQHVVELDRDDNVRKIYGGT